MTDTNLDARYGQARAAEVIVDDDGVLIETYRSQIHLEWSSVRVLVGKLLDALAHGPEEHDDG